MIDDAQLDAAIGRALAKRDQPQRLRADAEPALVRARPEPQTLEEACEIAAALTSDIRLRLEEREAIDMLVRFAMGDE